MNDGPLVVVVEDDEDDFFFTRRTLRKFIPGPIFHIKDGCAAIDYLAGAGPYANRFEFPRPHTLFVDLKMDKTSGHEVLAWIRENLPEPRPRVFVLTGSNEPRDRERVKNSGVATGYFVKPLAAADLMPFFAADSAPPNGKQEAG